MVLIMKSTVCSAMIRFMGKRPKQSQCPWILLPLKEMVNLVLAPGAIIILKELNINLYPKNGYSYFPSDNFPNDVFPNVQFPNW